MIRLCQVAERLSEVKRCEPAGDWTSSADFRQFLSMRALFRQQWQIHRDVLRQIDELGQYENQTE
jgi:hypothetical protein